MPTKVRTVNLVPSARIVLVLAGLSGSRCCVANPLNSLARRPPTCRKCGLLASIRIARLVILGPRGPTNARRQLLLGVTLRALNIGTKLGASLPVASRLPSVWATRLFY